MIEQKNKQKKYILMIIYGGKWMSQTRNHKPFPVTLAVNRCPARPWASGPPG